MIVVLRTSTALRVGRHQYPPRLLHSRVMPGLDPGISCRTTTARGPGSRRMGPGSSPGRTFVYRGEAVPRSACSRGTAAAQAKTACPGLDPGPMGSGHAPRPRPSRRGCAAPQDEGFERAGCVFCSATWRPLPSAHPRARGNRGAVVHGRAQGRPIPAFAGMSGGRHANRPGLDFRISRAPPEPYTIFGPILFTPSKPAVSLLPSPPMRGRAWIRHRPTREGSGASVPRRRDEHRGGGGSPVPYYGGAVPA